MKYMNEVHEKSNTKATAKLTVGRQVIGDEKLIIMAGPCAVESEEQIHTIAELVKSTGATILRGGAFKPRTSPDRFQGLGEEGLRYLKAAGEANDLDVVSEIMDVRDVDLLVEHVDLIQVGTRNMQNFSLLKELGKVRKPVLLKRGFGATINELLGAAEYILAGGNKDVILCERGIRTFETQTRSTLDLSAIPVLKEMTRLPVIVDPNHAAGRRDIIPALAKGAVAVGADGLIMEVHNNPSEALCDGDQALFPEQFTTLMSDLKSISVACGRSM